MTITVSRMKVDKLNFLLRDGMTGWAFSTAPGSDVWNIGERAVSSAFNAVMYTINNIHTGEVKQVTGDEILSDAHRMYSPIAFLNYPKTDMGKVFLLVEILMARLADNGA